MEEGGRYPWLLMLLILAPFRVTLANFVKEDAEYYGRRAGAWWVLTLIGGEFAAAIYRWLR